MRNFIPEKIKQVLFVASLAMAPNDLARKHTREDVSHALVTQPTRTAEDTALENLRVKFGAELVNSFQELDLSERAQISGMFKRDLPQWSELFDAFYPSVSHDGQISYGVGALAVPLSRTTNNSVFINGVSTLVCANNYDETQNANTFSCGAQLRSETRLTLIRKNLLQFAWEHIISDAQKVKFQAAVNRISDPSIDHDFTAQLLALVRAEGNFQYSGISVADETLNALNEGIHQFIDRRLSLIEQQQPVFCPGQLGGIIFVGTDVRHVTMADALEATIKRYNNFKVRSVQSGRRTPVEWYTSSSLFLQRATEFAYRDVMLVERERA